MTIEQILNNETGASVRTKLNALIDADSAKSVDTVADLLALTPDDGDVCQLLGYSAVNDGGYQILRYVANDESTVNGGTVFPGIGGVLGFTRGVSQRSVDFTGTAGTGRWLSSDIHQINVCNFGADYKGIADSTEAFQRSFNAKFGAIPAGVFQLTQSVIIPSDMSVNGAGRNKTILSQISNPIGGAYGILCTWDDNASTTDDDDSYYSRITISNLKIQGNFINSRGICAGHGGGGAVGSSDVMIESVHIKSCFHHIQSFAGSTRWTLSNCYFESADRGNVATNGAKDMTVIGCYFSGGGDDDLSWNNEARNCKCIGCHFEGTGNSLIKSNGWGHTISGNVFRNANKAIDIQGDANFENSKNGYTAADILVISGNTFDRCSSSMLEIQDCESVNVTGNTFDAKDPNGVPQEIIVLKGCRKFRSSNNLYNGEKFTITTGHDIKFTNDDIYITNGADLWDSNKIVESNGGVDRIWFDKCNIAPTYGVIYRAYSIGRLDELKITDCNLEDTLLMRKVAWLLSDSTRTGGRLTSSGVYRITDLNRYTIETVPTTVIELENWVQVWDNPRYPITAGKKVELVNSSGDRQEMTLAADAVPTDTSLTVESFTPSVEFTGETTWIEFGRQFGNTPALAKSTGTLGKLIYRGEDEGIIYSNSGGSAFAEKDVRIYGHRSGLVTPIGSLTPQIIGQEYLDTNAEIWYKATGLTSTDWVALN